MSNTHGWAGNVPRYFVYQALKSLGFGLFVAIWVIYLQQRRGLSLTEATVVDVTFLLVATVGEVPTGVVADMFGRKISLAMGSAIMSIGMLVWPVMSSVPLIVFAYAVMALGYTFTSGADDALFYESLKVAKRSDEYPRLAGRAGALGISMFAIGTAASGLLATLDLILPFLAGASCMGLAFLIVLTLRDPPSEAHVMDQPRKPYRQILREALALMRARPTLRYPMLYLAFVPLAAFLMETFFVQPQAVTLGVPLVGIGFIIAAGQCANIAGSAWTQSLSMRIGEARLIRYAPLVIVVALIGLAMLHVLPMLALIAVIGFVTAVLRPLVMNRIQTEVSDDIRATILSMNSLIASLMSAISELGLGVVADRAGLSVAYLVMACGIGVLTLLLFWKSRGYFPAASASSTTPGAAADLPEPLHSH